jgi:hypothetical protein
LTRLGGVQCCISILVIMSSMYPACSCISQGFVTNHVYISVESWVMWRLHTSRHDRFVRPLPRHGDHAMHVARAPGKEGAPCSCSSWWGMRIGQVISIKQCIRKATPFTVKRLAYFRALVRSLSQSFRGDHAPGISKIIAPASRRS